MSTEQGLKLTAYLGERDSAGGRLLADALLDVIAAHRPRAAVLLRGVEGFGLKHRFHTASLLTLSEDLPLTAVAVDTPACVHAILAEVERLLPHGLLTVERVTLLGEDPIAIPSAAGLAKLTVLLGRGRRAGGAPAVRSAVAALHEHGALGANVLVGLDGVIAGRRRRARFLSANRDVPAMILAVGEAARLNAALPALRTLAPDAPLVLERVQVCKRDGRLLEPPAPPPGIRQDGLAWWQKLTVHSGEATRHGHEPLHAALVRRLRAADAAGATTLRGLWGFHGDHEPHGERLLALARHTPMQTVALDTPEAVARLFTLVDELTDEGGLVTCESVPALRASAPERRHGGLRLAAPAAGPR